jgi:hypothetical protein
MEEAMSKLEVTDGDKIVAAILTAKACAPGTDLRGYVLTYQEALKLIAAQPKKLQPTDAPSLARTDEEVERIALDVLHRYLREHPGAEEAMLKKYGRRVSR